MKIAVMGTGGVGGYFGGRMAQAGLDVTFIARGKHMEAIRDHGLQVSSPGGDFLIKPAKVSDDPATVGPVDLILLATKAYDALAAIQQMKPMVGDQTVVLPVLNGISHIDQLNEILGQEHVLAGMAAIGAHVLSPGVIQHSSLNTITFGEQSGGVSERCKALKDALSPSGIEFVLSPNAMQSMWLKIANMAGLGVCSAARGGFITVRDTPETLELLRQSCAEAVRLAHAKNIPLSDSQPDDLVNVMRNSKVDFKPSMLVDLENGRRLEVESLNGAISRMGQEAGVPTPINDYIYACLKPWANGAPK